MRSLATPVLDRLSEPARLEALQRTGLLDTPADESFDRLTRLAASVLEVPVALVSLVEGDRQFFKSCVGLPQPWASARQTPLSHSFCQHVVASEEELVVADARKHPLLRDNLAIRDLDVVAYAGIPLRTSAGHALGSFCAIDSRPRQWTERELGILRDLAASAVTEIELRLAADQAERAREEIEQLSRTKSDFLGVMSHELRTPLTAILGYAELLDAGVPAEIPAEARRYVGRIDVAARHLLQLIEEILAFSRMEAGRAEVRRQRTDLDEVAAEAIAFVEPLAAKKNLPIRFLASGSDAVAETDRGKVRQVVVNLLSNAIKFTDAGEVRVRVEAAGPEIRLYVEDTGVGISPEHLERIFEPFWQVDQQNARTAGGTGLGLAISRRIARLLGGDVRAESTPGEGSAFVLSVPRDGSTRG